MKDAEFTECGQCKAYETIGGDDETKYGRCRRRAPQPKIYEGTDIITDFTIDWPLVRRTEDGCFEGIPK